MSDFDMQAAWLRRFTADAEGSFSAFARRLKEAMPDRVTLHESRGFFARAATLTAVEIDLADRRYKLALERGRLQASVAMVVRGITLNTAQVPPAEWFARLAEETKKASEHASALSLSLAAFMAA